MNHLNGHPITPTTRKPLNTAGAVPLGWLGPAFDAELTRLTALISRGPEGAFDIICAEGISLFDEHATSTSLSPRQTAAMLLALSHTRIRDHALMLTDRYGPAATHSTWAHLTRHAPTGHIAPAATLLAFAAWRLGDDHLARDAINRALTDQPDYAMARLLDRALNTHMPASNLPPIDRLWLADTWATRTH